MDVGTYATLLNQGVLVPSAKSNYVAVDKHFLANCMAPLLERIEVDEEWYLKAYPDVRNAISGGVVPNAYDHYIKFGFFEHRLPYRILVDESWYVSQYPDVREAIAKKHFQSGQNHFDTEGYREGRMPHPNFKLKLRTQHRAAANMPAAAE